MVFGYWPRRRCSWIGKSSLMQFLVENVNEDFGRKVFLEMGLENADADEHPLCAVLASFDMANARSLNAVFYEAARYACRFRHSETSSTLVERIRQRLVDVVGDDDLEALIGAVESVQENLRGRTLGPPVREFLELLCDDDPRKLSRYVDNVTPTKRARSGATFLATFLIMAKALGIKHVLLCCDQLEDFASTTTSQQKRALETERFRDYILELQPMCDMLSCIATMHPRATQRRSGTCGALQICRAIPRTTRSSTPCPCQPPSLPAQTCERLTDAHFRSRELPRYLSACPERATLRGRSG